MGTFLAVTTVLLMIIISGRLIKTMAYAAAGEMSMQVVLMALLLRLPSFLQIIIPMSLFIAVLIGYGRMYAESEMTVLTATGFSDRRLLGYTMVPGVFFMVLVGFCSLWLSPYGSDTAEELFVEESKKTEFELLTPGRFQSMSRGDRVTYTESLSSDKKQMRNVFIADGDSLIVAESGTQHVSPTSGSRYLELHEGRRYDLTPGSAELKVLDFDHYGVKIAEESPERKRIRKDAIPTKELFGQTDPKLRAQLHWRLSFIAMVPVVILLAFPLAKVNPRQGRFAKMFPALILFIVYVSLIAGLTGSVESGKLSPWVGFWAVHLFFTVLGCLFIIWPTVKRRLYVRRISA